MKIAIFCSANNQIDPDFFAKTAELGKWIAENGHSIVFGGCDMGLMECIAKAVHEGRGRTIGVIPSKVEENGHVSKYVDVEFPCNDLNDRKAIMLEQCDIAIVLPGGIGTLDELFTVAASATIGYHHKKVIVYDMKGFWHQLIVLLDDLQTKGVMRGDYHQYIVTATNLEEISHFIDHQ